VRVAQSWGIGQKGQDNGALLLVAEAERAVRIEVGYGLEDRLTDLLAGRIVDQEIIPRFKTGDFDGGISAGVQAMAAAVRGAYQGDPRSHGRRSVSPTRHCSGCCSSAPACCACSPAAVGAAGEAALLHGRRWLRWRQ